MRSYFIGGPPQVHDIDLVFALSATATSAVQTFQEMLDVVKGMIDKYKIGKVKYGLIVFGDMAVTKVR